MVSEAEVVFFFRIGHKGWVGGWETASAVRVKVSRARATQDIRTTRAGKGTAPRRADKHDTSRRAGTSPTPAKKLKGGNRNKAIYRS